MSSEAYKIAGLCLKTKTLWRLWRKLSIKVNEHIFAAEDKASRVMYFSSVVIHSQSFFSIFRPGAAGSFFLAAFFVVEDFRI